MQRSLKEIYERLHAVDTLLMLSGDKYNPDLETLDELPDQEEPDTGNSNDVDWRPGQRRSAIGDRTTAHHSSGDCLHWSTGSARRSLHWMWRI